MLYLQIFRKPIFLHISVSIFFQSSSRSTYEEFKPSLAEIHPGIMKEMLVENGRFAKYFLLTFFQIGKDTHFIEVILIISKYT